jgi:hypothetical protein
VARQPAAVCTELESMREDLFWPARVDCVEKPSQRAARKDDVKRDRSLELEILQKDREVGSARVTMGQTLGIIQNLK